MQAQELWRRYTGCYDTLTRQDSYSRALDDIVNSIELRPRAKLPQMRTLLVGPTVGDEHGTAKATVQTLAMRNRPRAPPSG